MLVNRNRFAALDQEVSGALRAEIARRRVSQVSIAETVGMHPNVLGRKIRGDVAFSAGELGGIASVLDLTGAEIMRRAEAALNEAGSLSTPGPLAPKAGADSSSTTGRRPSVQELLEHEAACDSCWSLDDAAGHLGLPSGAAAALAAEGAA